MVHFLVKNVLNKLFGNITCCHSHFLSHHDSNFKVSHHSHATLL
ncbi:MAG: hypothetical protein WCG25_09455 [bacterium]